MAKGINPIRKARLKQALLDPNTKSLRQAVLKAGYSEGFASQASRMTALKQVLAEIEAQFKLSELTPEMVIQQLQATRQLAIDKGDYSTAAFCSTQLGKYLAMFTDKIKPEGDLGPPTYVINTFNTGQSMQRTIPQVVSDDSKDSSPTLSS